MNKKIIIGMIATAAVVIGGIAAGAGYHHTQEEKVRIETEKQEKKHLDELTKLYDAAKFQTENAILDETERTALLESVNGYEKKLDGISKADEKEFKNLCKSVQEKYDASKILLEQVVAGIGSAYPTEEGYYTEEFTSSVTAMTQELNTLKDDGKYQDAYNKYNEINGAYMAYVEKVNAERAAAEEAAKKAGQETTKTENNKKNSTSTARSGGKDKAVSDSGPSDGSGNTSGGVAPSGSGSSSDNNSYEQPQKTDAPIVSEDKSTIKFPDDWTGEQIMEWLNEHPYSSL